MDSSAALPGPMKLSCFGSMMLWKEKMFYGRDSNEPEEFLVEYAKVLQLRNAMKEVETGMKKWLTASKSLGKAAKYLARAVDTDRGVYSQISRDLDVQLQDKSTFVALKKKVGMLDQLVKERKMLANLRHLKNRRTRKVNEALRKGVEEHRKRELMRIEDEEKLRYETHYSKLLESLKFAAGQGAKGHCELIRPELAAFKSIQFQFFLDCQKIIQGADKDEAENLNEAWNKFSVQMTDKRDGAEEKVEREFEAKVVPGIPEEEEDNDDDEKDDDEGDDRHQRSSSDEDIVKVEHFEPEEDESDDELEDDEDFEKSRKEHASALASALRKAEQARR